MNWENLYFNWKLFVVCSKILDWCSDVVAANQTNRDTQQNMELHFSLHNTIVDSIQPEDTVESLLIY